MSRSFLALIKTLCAWTARPCCEAPPPCPPAAARHAADRGVPHAFPAPSATAPTGPASNRPSRPPIQPAQRALTFRLMEADLVLPHVSRGRQFSKFLAQTISSKKMLLVSCAHEVEPPPDPRLCSIFNLHPAAATSADVGTGTLLRPHDRGLMLRPSRSSLRSSMKPLGNHPVDQTTLV